jgi:hypothetical protein
VPRRCATSRPSVAAAWDADVTKVVAFERVDLGVDCCEFLELKTVQVPITRVIEDGIVSWERARSPGREPVPGHFTVGFPRRGPVAVGTHQFNGGPSRRGFFRLTTSAEEFINWARRGLVPARGTAMRSWLRDQGSEPRGEDWEPLALRALGRLPQLLGSRGLRGRSRGLEWLCVAGDDLGLSSVEAGGRTVLARAGRPTVEVTIERRLCADAHRIPIVLRLRASREGLWEYYDGTRLSLGSRLCDLPRTALGAMDRRGTAFTRRPIALRPLADLRVAWMLRCPTASSLRDMKRAPGPPYCALRPALLFKTLEPLPLVGTDGGLVEAPVIDDPAQAVAILARSGADVYVPGATPVDLRDLPRFRGWLAGMQLPARVR